MTAPGAGRPRPGLAGRLAPGWRDYQYLARRLDEANRPWLYVAPLHWVHHRRSGWRLRGLTLPPVYNR